MLLFHCKWDLCTSVAQMIQPPSESQLPASQNLAVYNLSLQRLFSLNEKNVSSKIIYLAL